MLAESRYDLVFRILLVCLFLQPFYRVYLCPMLTRRRGRNVFLNSWAVGLHVVRFLLPYTRLWYWCAQFFQGFLCLSRFVRVKLVSAVWKYFRKVILSNVCLSVCIMDRFEWKWNRVIESSFFICILNYDFRYFSIHVKIVTKLYHDNQNDDRT